MCEPIILQSDSTLVGQTSNRQILPNWQRSTEIGKFCRFGPGGWEYRPFGHEKGKNLRDGHIVLLGGNGGLAPILLRLNPLRSKVLRISMATGLGTRCRAYQPGTMYHRSGGGGSFLQPLAEFPHPLKQGLRGCSKRLPAPKGLRFFLLSAFLSVPQRGTEINAVFCQVCPPSPSYTKYRRGGRVSEFQGFPSLQEGKALFFASPGSPQGGEPFPLVISLPC